ncbi:MAG: YhbY family RNA-binding protein [Clostridiales bacterium]|nr:YhbY family RNA-binding protein [Clostridiales bacterium]
MIDKKTRLELRSKASLIKPTVWVGKDGFNEKVLTQINEELFNHELVKISLQESVSMPSEFELTEMAVKLNAEVVTTIGKKIILYKHSEKKGIKHVLDK